MGMNAGSYLKQLRRLIPRGAAWPRDMQAGLVKLLDAISQELARVDARSDALMLESDPRKTVEMLTDWERAFGLPDPCVTRTLTQEERRNMLLAKITGIGGQSVAYYVGVAEDLGYVISITEFHPFQAGISVAGDALTNGDWVFTWRVNAVEDTIRPFLAGLGAAGEPLRTWGNDQLECVLSRLKPAHTILQFGYEPEIDLVDTLFGSGEQGGFYLPRPTFNGDPVLFQQGENGTTPVIADGDPVGLMLDLSRNLERTPEQLSDPGFDNPAAWTFGAGWSISGGVATADGSQAGNADMPKVTYNLVQGRVYEVKLDVIDITAGAAQVVFGSFGTIISAFDPGTYKAVFVSSVTASTTLFFGGRHDFVGAVDNASVKEITGNHAIQAVSASRPTYRTDGSKHWLEFDGVDDSLSVPGTASLWKFLHDGTGAFVSAGISPGGSSFGHAMVTVYDSFADAGWVMVQSSTSDSDIAATYNGGDLSSSAQSSPRKAAPAVFSSLIDSGIHVLRIDSEITGSGSVTNPSALDAGHDFTMGTLNGSIFSDQSFYGIIVHQGAGGIEDAEDYLKDLMP